MMNDKPTIEQVAWVFKHMADQLQEGGSFRYLIYTRMGYGPEAYLPLYEAGGMEITNALMSVNHPKDCACKAEGKKKSRNIAKSYDSTYGDEKLCVCGHPYRRHFDSYYEMKVVGCKYCSCDEFKEPIKG